MSPQHYKVKFARQRMKALQVVLTEAGYDVAIAVDADGSRRFSVKIRLEIGASLVSIEDLTSLSP